MGKNHGYKLSAFRDLLIRFINNYTNTSIESQFLIHKLDITIPLCYLWGLS